MTLKTSELNGTSNNVYGSSQNIVNANVQMVKLDDDSSNVIFSMVDNYTREAGNDNGSFQVKLTSRPLGNVRVDLQVEDPSTSVTLIPDNLTFSGNIPDYEGFISYLKNDATGSAMVELSIHLTTNHTHFNREAEHFDFFSHASMGQRW